jgi:hypothetical protein
MGKLSNMIILMLGITIMFNLFGLVSNNFAPGIIQTTMNLGQNITTLDPETGLSTTKVITLKDSPIALAIAAIIGITLAAAAAGLIWSEKSESLIIAQNWGQTASILGLLLSLAYDFFSVFLYIAGAVPLLATIVFAPILVYYLFTVLEWWRGIST